MGLFRRLKMGLVLTKDSLGLIRHNPGLAVFPLVSAIAGLAFLGLFLGILFGAAAITPEGGVLVVLFLAYLGLTFISSFFAAGLVHQTRDVIDGGNADLREGLQGAWDVRKPLFVWSFISATVGVILNALENADSRIGSILGMLFSVAWTLLTFFIIPVIVFEKVSVKEMFTQSASTFKSTWGETPISLAGVQLASILVALPVVLLGFLLLSVQAIIGIGVILSGILLGFLLGQTLQGVVKTVLYLYAEHGKRPEEFDNVDFDKLAGDNPGQSSGSQRSGVSTWE